MQCRQSDLVTVTTCRVRGGEVGWRGDKTFLLTDATSYEHQSGTFLRQPPARLNIYITVKFLFDLRPEHQSPLRHPVYVFKWQIAFKYFIDLRANIK